MCAVLLVVKLATLNHESLICELTVSIQNVHNALKYGNEFIAIQDNLNLIIPGTLNRSQLL